jgi:hypothetical protein
MAQPPLGSGKRFSALSNKLASRPGVTNPDALAAYIGRKKLGAKKFNSLAAKGRAKSDNEGPSDRASLVDKYVAQRKAADKGSV